MEEGQPPPYMLAAYRHRALTRKEIVDWADRQIAKGKDPGDWIIELATRRFEREHEFITFLERQGLTENVPLADRLALVAVARIDCGLDLDTAIAFLYRFYHEDEESLIPSSAQLVIFDDPRLPWDETKAAEALAQILRPHLTRGRQLRHQLKQDRESGRRE